MVGSPATPVSASTEWGDGRADAEPPLRTLEALVTSWTTLALQADPPQRRAFLDVVQRAWARMRLPGRMLREASDFGLDELTSARLVRRFLVVWPPLRAHDPRERERLLVMALVSH